MLNIYPVLRMTSNNSIIDGEVIKYFRRNLQELGSSAIAILKITVVDVGCVGERVCKIEYSLYKIISNGRTYSILKYFRILVRRTSY